MESEFHFRWGSQKLEPKIGIPNLDDDNDRDMGNDDNVHGNANKGGRQFVACCLSGRDYCR
jgi:hypothetical protein